MTPSRITRTPPTEEDKALSALNKLQPTLVGAKSMKWPVIKDDKMTLHIAVVTSIDKDDVFGKYESNGDIAAGKFSTKMNVAASFFVPIGGVDLPSVYAQDWRRIVAWAGARMSLENDEGGERMITGSFITSFAAALGELKEEEIHRLSRTGCLPGCLGTCLAAIDRKVIDIIDPELAMRSTGAMPTFKQLTQAAIRTGFRTYSQGDNPGR